MYQKLVHHQNTAKIPATENPYTLGYTSTSKLKTAGFLTAIDSLPVISATPRQALTIDGLEISYIIGI